MFHKKSSESCLVGPPVPSHFSSVTVARWLLRVFITKTKHNLSLFKSDSLPAHLFQPPNRFCTLQYSTAQLTWLSSWQWCTVSSRLKRLCPKIYPLFEAIWVLIFLYFHLISRLVFFLTTNCWYVTVLTRVTLAFSWNTFLELIVAIIPPLLFVCDRPSFKFESQSMYQLTTAFTNLHFVHAHVLSKSTEAKRSEHTNRSYWDWSHRHESFTSTSFLDTRNEA